MSPRSRPFWLAVGVAALALGWTTGLDAQCRVADLSSASIGYCVTGSGAPTIVLAAGAGMSSATWRSLTPDLSTLGTVVTFDRPGFGRSPSGAPPRSPARISSELAELLESADLPEPFVLVGNSMGGIHVVGAAALIPERTAGVVMLDSPHPAFESRRLDLLTTEQRRAREEILAQGLVGAPTVVGDERTGATNHPTRIEPGILGAVPLVLVVATGQNFGPDQPQAHRELWLELSGEWLDLSSTARLVLAEGSGHMIHLERTDLVIEILRDLTASLR